ncbi:MAG: hypothetical protein PUF12_05600, partial [Thermoflexaceae bacterium]|nr:hypothetical protein [Thermoflexaceae bacterium]
RIYRHDMRHHFNLILGFIQEDKISEVVTYINENIEGIEKITPQKFCDMEVLNLLLSHFTTIANVLIFCVFILCHCLYHSVTQKVRSNLKIILIVWERRTALRWWLPLETEKIEL